MARTVSIVPHTHWDREWHQSFQRFRLRLVDLLDDLLPRLDADPSYRHFLLDGQMAVVDDYLEVRPAEAGRLTRLNRTGRLAMGPWYTLPDEFLVSGETLVRNLRLGLDRAATFGGAMPVGYLPDMFGHVAQMPQILRSFGFEHAVVWRGVPAAVDRSAFHWTAPDGSTVRAEYLAGGYGNGARLPDDAKDLVRLIARFEEDHDDSLVGPILWMNGSDHVLPRPWLGRVVAEANELQAEYELVIRPLAEHLAAAPVADLPRWRGELRSGARANLLMGVASNRVDVKQAAARAERTLERVAEPLNALFRPPEAWPGPLLDLAWRSIIRNSAHDSICACSADSVVEAVLHRYTEATDIGAGLAEQALRALGDQAGTSGAVVVNPAAHTRSGVIELELPGTGEAPGLQVLAETPTEQVLHRVGMAEAATIVERELDIHPELVSLTLDETGDSVVVTLTAGERLLEAPPAEAGTVVDRLRHLAGRRPDAPVRVDLVRPPRRRALVATGPVAGFGWKAWRPVPSSDEVRASSDGHGTVLRGSGIAVEVDPADGTWSVDGHAGLGRLVDDGDAGDTYNYSPPAGDRAVTAPEAVTVEVVEPGPLRAAVEVAGTYDWPERIGDGVRTGSAIHIVRTRLELRAGEPFVRVTTTVDNRSRDHRLRAWFPLPHPTAGSTAECAFATVDRGLRAEGGPTELGLPTFPSRRFVTAGGLVVSHEGLLEYELVDVRPTGPDGTDEAHALALTLLRATGMLSQGPMRNRPLPAGPLDPLEGPQLSTTLSLRYVVAVGDHDPYRLTDDAFVPLLVTNGGGARDGRHEGRALEIDGAVVSAVERRAGALHVRVFNPRPDPATVTLPGRHGWTLDLAERPLAPFDGRVELRPHEILTLALGE
jgi:hypothetical protein